jgi:membrane-associated protease RseP (regulator of RpoE activity)
MLRVLILCNFSALACLQRGEVEYSLRAIPLGGYVAFPDDDPKSSYSSDDPDLLQNRNVAQRAVVISAGVVANVLFALAILFAQVRTLQWEVESGCLRMCASLSQGRSSCMGVHGFMDTARNNICS